MGAPSMSVVQALVLLGLGTIEAGLLGAGHGQGSCAAAPFRSTSVQWSGGCPASASCCSEYGYCRPQAEWVAGKFRDCNGQSNGTPLAADAVAAEQAAAANGDTRGLALLGSSVGAGIGAGGAGSGAGGAGFGIGGTGFGTGGAGFGI